EKHKVHWHINWRDSASEAFVPLVKKKCKPGQLVKVVREKFFNETGAVSWQADMCLLH
ncbi:hypothetical protein AVEN_106206-1, partial [Araneus ventricosus]